MYEHMDETHDAGCQSWVDSARNHPVFPLQNLPLGIFSPRGGNPRGGVAIGDHIFDLQAALDAGLFSGSAGIPAAAAAGTTINPLMALGKEPRRALRKRLWELLVDRGRDSADAQRHAADLLHEAADCTMHLPAAIGGFSDFYAGIHHAYNGGLRHKRPAPLLPNYKYVPVAYNGRASSVVVSGTPIRRPKGQRRFPGEETPSFGLCTKLDYELELGIWIGPGKELGNPIPISEAGDHIAGFCMLNDWSARDIQTWEQQPLGPFVGKSFSTTISPWVVTPEALAPFRQPQPTRPDGDPRPLPYLWDDSDQQQGGFDVWIEPLIMTQTMRAKGMPPHRLALSNLKHLYWTVAQMVAHHTCGGCNLRPGDIFGSGTISSPDRSGLGSLAELSDDGKTKIELPSGETRTFIEDGDEIIMRAQAKRHGFATIGFGDCRGVILGNP